MVDIASSSGRFHFAQHRRWIPVLASSYKTLFASLWVAVFMAVFLWQSSSVGGGIGIFRWATPPPLRAVPRLRAVAYNLTDFGGVGDGKALNTEAFERAVAAIARLARKGGGQLVVPPGRWLTAPFNLTSHMTLFLAEGAEILGIQFEMMLQPTDTDCGKPKRS